MPKLGTLFILSSALLYGLYPVLIAFVPKGAVSPLLFLVNSSGIAFLTVVLALSGALLWTKLSLHSSLLELSQLKTVANPKVIAIGLGNALCNACSFGALYYAIQSGPILETAILYELWATFFLIYSFFLRRGKHGEFSKVHGTSSTIIFFIIGAAGVVAVAIGSHLSSSPTSTQDSDILQEGFTFGKPLIAAILAPFLMAGSFVFSTRNALLVSTNLHPKNIQPSQAEPKYGILGAMLVVALNRGISLVGALVLFYLFSPQEETNIVAIYSGEDVLLPMLATGLLVGIGGVAAPIGNNLNKTSNANLLYYLVPFFTVIWLYLFGFSNGFQSISFLGAVLVMAANYILTSEYNHSFSFKAAIATLCVSASIVFLVEPLDIKPIYEMIGALIGVFGILSAFLIDRIYTDAKENLTIDGGEFTKRALLTHGQGVFILWVLGFGILMAVFCFRSSNDMQHDFLAVVLAVSVVYISLVPVDAMTSGSTVRLQSIQLSNDEIIKSLQPLIISAIFIGSLFLLLFIGLLIRSP